MKKIAWALAMVVLISSAWGADSRDLEFLEGFAWGDRAQALKTLVPDTDDYYYYSCLQAQLAGDTQTFDRLLKQWLVRNQNNWNGRMLEMRRRQMLLTFPSNPDATWQFLRDDFSLAFTHRPKHEQTPVRGPSALTPDRYSAAVFRQEAMRLGWLEHLTPRGLELAVSPSLSPELRRALLGRLDRPDLPGTLDLIVADLEAPDSRGFGSLPVHRLLTRDQLEELGRRSPALLRDDAYVNERLTRMLPSVDVDWVNDPAAAARYYQDVWTFVGGLEPMHNSLKANVLFHLLNAQQRLGVTDDALFRAYLELPRPVSYLPRERQIELRNQRADMVNFNYEPVPGLALSPIGSEESLVRDFLITQLRDAADPSAYSSFFEARWLNAVFAESKILNGIGKPEDWASFLTPVAYRAILDRVEVNFARQNPSVLRPGDPVELQVDVKRVDDLRIKIYEIQTFNYYTTHQAPVDQAVELDGMVATWERTLPVKADPGRRVRHTLKLPEITRRGVYVVELIGNGVSSRALLHIGRLEAITQATAVGQAVMVLNEAGETVQNAALWLQGREFTANEQGLILLPFSENPGPRFAVLRDGDFCSPEQFVHLGENITFSAGVHLDPQSLVRRASSRLVLRPDLRMHGLPIDPALLGDVKVTLAATDARGTRTERLFTAKFEKNTEWETPFYVPDALRRLEVTVEAKWKRLTDREEITLTDAGAVDVNQARAADVLKQIFLSPHRGGWALEVRGLNGEEVADLPLTVNLYHPAFTQSLSLPVTTDSRGRVDLGPLTDLYRIDASGPDGLTLIESLAGGSAVMPTRLHLMPGEAVSLPYPVANTQGLKPCSLFQTRNGKYIADRSDHVTLGDGQAAIAGLPAGEYLLTLQETGARVTLVVAEGEARSGFILGKTLRLQQTGLRLPSLADVKPEKKGFALHVRNATPSTRVAVRAYRYAGPGGEFPVGGGFPAPAFRQVFPSYVQTVSGRNIGDEYRYVLDRQTREIFAGSLLERPGLILNPWELRETTAEREQLKQDQAYRHGRQAMNEVAEEKVERRTLGRFAGRSATAYAYGIAAAAADIGFDFLPEGSGWRVNLRPDADGMVQLPVEASAEHTALEIVVLDRFGSSRSRFDLPDASYEPRDVRLRAGLDPQKPFSRQKTVRIATPEQPVVFPDLSTTRYQVIRTVPQAFDLLQTLGGVPEMKDFAFLKDWPKLDREMKLKKYGEFACHELHLFLYEKDRPFFDDVIRPYLANKKDKTFVDRWLLEALTPEETRLDKVQQRNALELALLARRGGDPAVCQAALREAWELLPPDPEALARRIQVALQASELDEKKSLARDKAQTEAEGMEKSGRKMDAVTAAGGGFGLGSSDRGSATGMDQKDADLKPKSAPAPSAPASFALKEPEPAVAPGDVALLMDMESDAFGGAGERLYRALPKTKEWAEQNYYHVRAQQDVAARVTVNGFWRDVAAKVPVSSNLLEAHRSLTEALAALAFCGLPYEAAEPEEKMDGAQLTLRVKTPALLVSEQILPAAASADDRPLLLSQQFFRPDDLYRYDGNERIEKFINGEFVRRTVYGERVTLTNPTASRRRLNVLMQLPLGAIPLRNGFYTDDVPVLLEPYTTRTLEIYFTFPAGGEFSQFPAQASADEAVIGRAGPRVFRVVDAPTEVDKTSWAWVSQYASNADTLAFLRDHNIRRLDLNDMAWRLKDRSFFEQAADLLTSRGLFHDTTFSYAVAHKDADRARVWLSQSRMRTQVGPVLESALLTVDPVEDKTYEHLEYDPLVNPRTHPVGEKLKILNSALDAQYRAFLHNALYRAEWTGSERLGLAYYLLTQDRISEAVAELAKIKPADEGQAMQTAYLNAWLALRQLDPDRALALAKPYLECPAPRWNARFQAVAQAVKEARGAETVETEDPNRQQDLDQLAAQTPSVELAVEAGRIRLTAHALKTVTLNLYPMDIELLFSRKPFLSEGGADFAVIKPAYSADLKIAGNGEPEVVELPEAYRGRNLMVEVVGQGQRAGVAWYANKLRVRKMERVGQIEVRAAQDGKPLPRTYVKVFARGEDGRESFWKDGYTDLRGRFDYLSLNDREPEEAAEFSILVLHPECGAEILSATPPTR